MQRDGALAFAGAQVDVAARERQPVPVAHRAHRLDAHRDVEVGDEPADDGELLEILFAEQGDVRRDLVEQLGDDDGDAVEMSGPGGAVQASGHPRHADAGGVTLRVHRRRVRGPEQLHPFRLQHRSVRAFAPRVGGEILAGAELGGIDEDRGDDVIGASFALRDQRHVAGVQRAHRRHEGDTRPVGPERRHGVSERREITQDLHGLECSDRGLGRIRGASLRALRRNGKSNGDRTLHGWRRCAFHRLRQ